MGLKEPTKLMDLRGETAAMLRDELAAINLENFVVRPHRRLVERYANAEAWEQWSSDAVRELAGEVAGLPSELPAEDEEAKRFDLLMLRTQLAILRKEPSLEKLRAQVKLFAALLEENSRVPAILAQLDLIQTIQSDEWRQDVTPQMIEQVRRKLRSLMQLIEKKKRMPVYSDFKDELGEGEEVQLAELTTAADFERFREKARHFLRQHEDHIAIHKLRTNEPLTKLDLEELERMLTESGVSCAGNPKRNEFGR